MTWFLLNWRAIALAALIAVPTLYAVVAKHQRDSARAQVVAVKAEYAAFVAQVKAAGEAQEAKAKAQAAADKKVKEKADANHKRELDRLSDAYRRLRDNRARADRFLVPAAAPGAANPDRACYDRAELGRALREFDSRALDLAREGAEGIAGLNASREWAQK